MTECDLSFGTVVETNTCYLRLVSIDHKNSCVGVSVEEKVNRVPPKQVGKLTMELDVTLKEDIDRHIAEGVKYQVADIWRDSKVELLKTLIQNKKEDVATTNKALIEEGEGHRISNPNNASITLKELEQVLLSLVLSKTK